MRSLIFLLVAGGGLMFIVYQIVKFFFSISNPKSRVQKDRKYGLIKLRELTDVLIPINSEELSLLSSRKTAVPSRKTFHTEEFGHLDTIYNEHLIAYYLFDYLDDRKLLLTETSDIDVEFYKEKDVTNIWLNGKLLYEIDKSGRLSNIHTKQIIARINITSKMSYHTISVGGEVRAQILNNQVDYSEQQRIYPIIELIDTEESQMIYCLTMYNLFFS